MADQHVPVANQTEESGGLTRREILRKGAILGGAIAWTTPVVQAVGMSPAFADHASPLCCTETTLTVENSETSASVTTIDIDNGIDTTHENCNCGTHGDDVNPAGTVFVLQPGEADPVVWYSYTCQQVPIPPDEKGLCRLQEFTDGQDGTEPFPYTIDGVYDVWVILEATQNGVTCEDESNHVTVTVS